MADALVIEPLDASADALLRLLTARVRATRVTTAGDGLAALEARPAGFAVAFVSLDATDAAPVVDALLPHRGSRRTTVAAIVPAGRRGGADLDCLGPALRLTRPVRRARLVECLDAISARVPAGPGTGSRRAAVRDTPARAPRVLVADDYFANQRLVTRLLEKRGYTVEVVGDGQAAVDATLDRGFDVVLMDCNMPLLDGYEATARIRALEHGRRGRRSWR